MSNFDTSEARLFEGRRRQDRVSTDMTIEIRRQRRDLAVFLGEVLNLSRGGLGLRLDRGTELQVRWACQTSSSKEVEVLFRLPCNETLVAVEARCRVVWSKDAGQERSRMGLEVIEFLGNGQKTVEEFLAAQSG